MADKLDEKVDKLADVVTRLAGSVDEMRLEFRDVRMDFHGLRGEFRDLRKDFEGIKVVLNSQGSAIARIEKKVDQTNAQFGDVIKKVIEHEDKIENLDGRVSTLELGVH